MSSSGGGGIGRREVAVRCFAAEYDDAELEYSESDEERAPNYVVTPSGARVNRLFVVGVLTEVEPVSDDVLRARVVDPTGAFVVYAGQYQPDAKTFLERAEPPQFVAVTGKARTFEPDDADTVYTSIRPESINAVDADTRDRWTVQTAEFTLDRVATFAAALDREERGEALREVLLESGVDPALAAGVPRAMDHYGTTEAYLAAVREAALQAAEVVAGDRDEVEPLGLAPGEGGRAEVDLAAGADVTGRDETAGTAEAERPAVTSTDAAADASTDAEASAGTVEATAEGGTAGAASSSEPDTGAESESGAEVSTGDEVGAEAEVDTETDVEAGTDVETGTGPESPTAPDQGAATADATGGAAAGDPSTGAGPDSGDEDALGDFDDFGSEDDAGDAGGTGSADVGTDERYEMDDAEREAIEAEHGTEFSTGNEVAEPGEADVDAPGPVEGDDHDASETAATTDGSTEGDSESATTAAPAAPEDEAAAPGDEAGVDSAQAEGQVGADEGQAPSEGEPSTEDETGAAEGEAEDADEVDLQDAVVDAMADLDEGDGADRGAVIDAVVDEHGADRGAVEGAIQDALMGGRCYEPEDGRLKAI